jgi:hypothetical protein
MKIIRFFFKQKKQVLIFTRPHEIRGVGINKSDHHVIPPISLPDVSNPAHLDFVAARREIYWSDEGSSSPKIMRFVICQTNYSITFSWLDLLKQGSQTRGPRIA